MGSIIFFNSYELYGKLINGIIRFLILSGIIDKERKKEKVFSMKRLKDH